MKLYASFGLGIALFMSACSENGKTSFNECPQDSTCLYKEISSTQYVMPDTYKAHIRINESDMLRKGGEIQAQAKKDIASTLNEVIALSKQSGFCEGGEYDLKANIQYKDGAARDTIGYTLRFDLECEIPSKQKESYTKLINDIDSKIAQNKYISFLAPTLSIVTTPESWQKAQNEAFNNALTLAKDQASQYALIIDKKCTLVVADALTHTPQNRDFFRASSMSAPLEFPISKEQEVSAKLQAKYICQ